MGKALIGVFAAVLAMVLGLGGVASAQGPGVTVDSDSPAGKEYAIPVNRAKEEAGVTDGSTGSTTSAGLFGAGVAPAGSPPRATEESSSGSERPGSKSASGQRPREDGEGGSSESAGSLSTGASAVAAPAPSSDALPYLAGGAALVLLAGVGGGLVARRRTA